MDLTDLYQRRDEAEHANPTPVDMITTKAALLDVTSLLQHVTVALVDVCQRLGHDLESTATPEQFYDAYIRWAVQVAHEVGANGTERFRALDELVHALPVVAASILPPDFACLVTIHYWNTYCMSDGTATR